MVPAVAIATSAPALAVSGDTLAYSGTISSTWNSGTSKSFKISGLVIKATSTHSTVANLTLIVTFPSSVGAVTGGTGSSWTGPTLSTAGGITTATFTASVTGTAGGASSPAFNNVAFTATNHVANAQVSYSVRAPGYDGGNSVTTSSNIT